MTSNHHGPYGLGYTRATMAITKKLLVIPNQHVGVNAFPGLVHTARHAMGVGSAQSR